MTKKISEALIKAKTFFFTAETKFELLLNILIIVLAGGVLVLGVLLTVRYQIWLKVSMYLTDGLPKKEKIELPAADENKATQLTEENELLNLSSDEMVARYQEIQAAAVETSQITVNSCLADPAIAIVTLGQSLAFENQSNFPIALVIGEETIELDANSTQEVIPSFTYGIGTYGYYCDSQGRAQSSDQNTGILIVKE